MSGGVGKNDAKEREGAECKQTTKDAESERERDRGNELKKERSKKAREGEQEAYEREEKERVVNRNRTKRIERTKQMREITSRKKRTRLTRRNLVRHRSSSEASKLQVFSSVAVPILEFLPSVLILESLGSCCWIGDSRSSSPSRLRKRSEKKKVRRGRARGKKSVSSASKGEFGGEGLVEGERWEGRELKRTS